jgi:hypothetical protein
MKTRVITVVSILTLVSASFAFMMPNNKKVETTKAEITRPATEPIPGGGGIDPK